MTERTAIPSKPSPSDIATAIEAAETGDWIDPSEEPINWYAILHDPDGKQVGNGNAHTPREAMAFAWLCAWAPDALIDAYVEPGSVPFTIPDGWSFELFPPGKNQTA
jgi:hypothetical protein